jgi:hypothetical protein
LKSFGCAQKPENELGPPSAQAMDAEIILPARVFEQNLPNYVKYLLKAGDCDQITLDFKKIAFFTPGAVVGTLAVAYV